MVFRIWHYPLDALLRPHDYHPVILKNHIREFVAYTSNCIVLPGLSGWYSYREPSNESRNYPAKIPAGIFQIATINSELRIVLLGLGQSVI